MQTSNVVGVFFVSVSLMCDLTVNFFDISHVHFGDGLLLTLLIVLVHIFVLLGRINK